MYFNFRQVKPIQTTTALSSAPSIQITLQTNRAAPDMSQIIAHQQPVQKPVHLSHGMALSTSKMLMSQTPISQHSVLSNLTNKTNKCK